MLSDLWSPPVKRSGGFRQRLAQAEEQGRVEIKPSNVVLKRLLDWADGVIYSKQLWEYSHALTEDGFVNASIEKLHSLAERESETKYTPPADAADRKCRGGRFAPYPHPLGVQYHAYVATVDSF